MNSEETPEQRRERMRQEELKRHPFTAFGDGFNRSFADLIGSLSWKSTGVLILLIVIGYVIYTYFFK